MDLRYNPRKGYWVSDKRLKFELDRKIENIEEFGASFLKFLKLFKDLIPVETEDIYPVYTMKKFDGEREYYQKGWIILALKGGKSIRSKLNPMHDKVLGDETIIIAFLLGDKYFTSFQEAKSEYHGMKYVWKLPSEDMKQLKALFTKFAAGVWLGLDKLI